MDNILIAIINTFQPHNLFYVFAGVMGGVAVGAMPGMTSVMLCAIVLPFCFKMPADGAIIMMISICSGANYGGGISATLFNMPGTPSAAATAIDGFPMCRKGEGGRALLGVVYASFFGGIFSWIIMVMATPLIARFALMFGPTEYTTLMIWAFTIIGMLETKQPLKGITAGVFGLLLSCVGMEGYSAKVRYTFGILELMEGLNVTWASIGIFALVQVLRFVKDKDGSISPKHELDKNMAFPIKETFFEVLGKWRLWVYTSLVGLFVGAAPGAGPSIASFMAYGEAKRLSKHPETFGQGEMDGVIACESANNACGFGSLIPMLSLGIPGSTTAALTMSACIVVGLQPGPELFTKQLDLVYTIFGGAFIGNFVFLLFGMFGARFFVKMLDVPANTLIPIVVMAATMGVYSTQQSVFGIYVTLAFCAVGYILSSWGFPLTPMLLGLILGGIMENHFLRAMVVTKRNIGKLLFFSPLSSVFTVLTVVSVITIFLRANPKIKAKLSFKKS